MPLILLGGGGGGYVYLVDYLHIDNGISVYFLAYFTNAVITITIREYEYVL